MLNNKLVLFTFVCMWILSPVAGAESCRSHDLSGVGHCKVIRYARKVVREQLQGIEPQQISPPVGMDATLLATQLSRTLSVGNVYPVHGSSFHDWALLAYPSSVNPADLTLAGRRTDQQPSLVAVIRWSQPGPSDSQVKPTATVLALTKKTLIPGQTDDASDSERETKSAADSLYCVVPKSETDGSDPGSYPEYSKFRWLQLSPKHRVLVATITRNEGYAGGGGSFEAELLVDTTADGSLRPIACYATNSYQMIAGEWNQDGTRNHDEYQAGWKLVVDRQSREEWPRLRLRPTTAGTSGATLVWDGQRQQYINYP